MRYAKLYLDRPDYRERSDVDTLLSDSTIPDTSERMQRVRKIRMLRQQARRLAHANR